MWRDWIIIPSLSGVVMIYKHNYWNGESIPRVLHVDRMIISGFFSFPPLPSVWVRIPSVMRDWRGWWKVWNPKQSYEPSGEWEGELFWEIKTKWHHNIWLNVCLTFSRWPLISIIYLWLNIVICFCSEMGMEGTASPVSGIIVVNEERMRNNGC